jgi:predicted metal-dependent phosphoesterase TrpH
VTGVAALSNGPAQRFVDLHSHSTASDGSKTPAAVVAAAHAAGLSAIALTDHDTMAGVDEALAAGREMGIRVVAGVELSATHDEKEVHLLGLHIDRPAAIDDALRTFRDTRYRRAEEIIAKLNALGVPLTFQAVLDQSAGAAIGRPHIARALIEEGWARDSRDAFDRYLGAGRPAYVPKHRLSVGEAIALVHDGGGLAVLAHPGSDGRRDVVERYVSAGLDGLEVRHPGHNSEDTARLGALAQFFKLVQSGGSDWHGASDGARVLGAMHVPAAWLDEQDERLESRRAAGRVA